jgi:hypothetical protein
MREGLGPEKTRQHLEKAYMSGSPYLLLKMRMKMREGQETDLDELFPTNRTLRARFPRKNFSVFCLIFYNIL